MVNGRRDLYTSAGYPLASKQASDARPNRLQLSFEVCLLKLMLPAASHAYVSRDRLRLAPHQRGVP